MWDAILLGISNAFSFNNILAAFAGTFLGIIIGGLPGLTPTMGMAVLIPLTYGMDTVWALIFLVGIYAGCFYGGSISATLINTPGTPAAAATALDGYPMTQKGMAYEALTESACASFWGGALSFIALIFLSPALATFSLRFGFEEKFWMAFFGICIIASLSTKSMVKGLISGTFGLFLAVVGRDIMYGFPRFTFGIPSLTGGIPLVPALIGLFSIPQIFYLITNKSKFIVDWDALEKVKNSRPTLKDLFRYPIIYLRSALIGIIVGIIPGAGGNVASFIAYNQSKMYSKNREEYGYGCREGIASSEAANNAVTGGSLIPMLTLGIPGNAVTAVLLSALILHGLQPGISLFTEHAEMTYTFFVGFLVANVFMLLIGVFGAKYFAKLALTPTNILAASILVLSIVGSYAIKGSMIDVYIMLAFGAIGFFLKMFKFDTTPAILGLILGNMAEEGLRQSLLFSHGLFGFFKTSITRPISLVLILLTLLSLFIPLIQMKTSKKTNIM